MRARLHKKLIAALLAPALLIAGAAQGLWLVRCGSTVKMSCCCPKEAPPAINTLVETARHCGERLSLPAAPDQRVESLRALSAAPVLIAVLGPSLQFVPSFLEEDRAAPRLDPPPGAPPLLVSCSLLI